MTKDRFTPCAFALLASLSLAACSSSGSDQAMTPAPVTPAPETPAPETPEPETPEPGTPEPGEVTTETSLATGVVTALTIEEGDAASGIAVATNITGAEGAPVLSDTTYTVDGQTYTLVPFDGSGDSALATGDLYAVEVLSVDGVKAVASGVYGDPNEQGIVVDRTDILFSAAPTQVADLPNSTANYTGTFDAFFIDIQDDDAQSETGIFTATADFGTAQTLTGSLNAENADGSVGEQHAILTADIEGNSFVGVINNDVDDPNNTDEQISAAGYFTGDNASGLVGAAAGTFVHSEDESEEALIVFQATAE